jgi:hypothetical protein
MKILTFLFFLVVSASASATGTSHGCDKPGYGIGCNNPAQPKAEAHGGHATTGPIDVANVAKNWSSMSSDQRQKAIQNMDANQRQQLSNAISIGFDITTKVEGARQHQGQGQDQGQGQGQDQQAHGGAGGTATGNGAGNTTSVSNRQNIVYLPPAPPVAPTVIAQPGAIIMTGQCGPRMEVETIPIEYLLVGHVGMDKVQLSGQTTDRLVPARDGQKFVTVDNGDGSKSEMGTIATTAITTVSGSTSKQFGLGLIGSNAGGNVSNGVAGAISINMRFINVGQCELRRWKEIQPVAAAAPEPATLLVVEEVTTPGRRGGTVVDIPKDFCKENPGKCRQVSGSAGKRTIERQAFDCTKRATPEVARLCAEAKDLIGKPPVRTEMPSR